MTSIHAVLAANAVCGSLASDRADCRASHVALAATETMLTPATTANRSTNLLVSCALAVAGRRFSGRR
ncbi:hypothetical protein [Nonomuraea jabiensis]|uniref:hypothetical protein n=1 Tax=Nonomuraea jabiensis TaxID=882448 RepID=UPI003D73A40E